VDEKRRHEESLLFFMTSITGKRPKSDFSYPAPVICNPKDWKREFDNQSSAQKLASSTAAEYTLVFSLPAPILKQSFSTKNLLVSERETPYNQ
jgi:hypothetical protein